MGTPASNLIGVIGMIAALAGVLALTYYATRLIAKLMGGQLPDRSSGGITGSPVKVRSRLVAAKGVYLMTVAYNKKEYLLGVSERQVSVLDTRELDEGELQELSQPAQGGFSSRLQNAIKQYSSGRSK